MSIIYHKERTFIKPVIKWTGGKYREFSLFRTFIPPFKNYFEPFAGGAGVFFALQPGHKSYLNDKSTDLIRFYRMIGKVEFEKELNNYVYAWNEAGEMATWMAIKLADAFSSFVNNETVPQKIIKSAINTLPEQKFPTIFSVNFIIDKEGFMLQLEHSLFDKMKRIKAIMARETRSFSKSELHTHMETAVKSAFYLFIRGLMNRHYTKKLSLPEAKAVANWFFVREFCYASMFRYNRQGEFNIPYGGIAYNKKDFGAKVKHVSNPSIKQLFAKTDFFNHDFAEFLEKVNPGKEDFIFLDPPYDSEFSEYDQHVFNQHDQVRLRDTLLLQKAKWMLVIKKTDFIENLYSHDGIHIHEFDKTYTYNVRGRNSRNTKHLVIMNYSP